MAPYVGFENALIDKNEVDERNVLDFAFTFDLAGTYPIGEDCVVEIEWTNLFAPSWILINDVQTECDNMLVNKNILKARCKMPEKINSEGVLDIHFKKTLVVKNYKAAEDNVEQENVGFI